MAAVAGNREAGISSEPDLLDAVMLEVLSSEIRLSFGGPFLCQYAGRAIQCRRVERAFGFLVQKGPDLLQ